MLITAPKHKRLRGARQIKAAICFVAAARLAFAPVIAQETDDRYDLRIEGRTLGQSIAELHKQTGARLWFDYDLASTTGLRPVTGWHTIEEALKMMLQGSGLTSGLTESGMIVITRSFDDKASNREGSVMHRSRNSLLATVSSVVAGLFSASATANAQEAETAAPSDTIVVSASRIKSSSFEAPTPETTVTADDMETRGITDFADMLNQLPSFQPFVNPSSTSLASTANGSNVLNLRGLGNSRTLVLVNGRRVPPGGRDLTVNTNVIPQALIRQIDTVTGGASAAWGSDAVAGVVNIGLDRHFNGARVKTQFGVSNEGDGEDYLISFAFGGDVANGKGHLVVGADYNDNQGVNSLNDRDWSRNSTQLVSNPANTGPADGIPAYITADHARSWLMSDGGHTTTGDPAIAFTQFDSPTSFSPFNPGTIAGIFGIGSDGSDLGSTTHLATPSDRVTLMSLFDYDVAENITFFFEGSFAKSNARAHTIAPEAIITGAMTINSGNPFIPEDFQTLLTDNGVTSFSLWRWNRDFGVITADNTTDVWRIAAGFEGKIFQNWDYEIYYQYARSNYESRQFNNLIKANLAKAVDVVDLGAGPVCASGDAACAPLNPFGYGSPSAAAIAYVTGTSFFSSVYEQEVLSASASGSLFELPAGDVLAAFGVEYRNESTDGEADDLSLGSQWAIANFVPVNGGYNTKEIFGEVSIPLLADRSFADALDVNGAVRYADYSSIGGALTWKAGVRYSPVRGITFRGTYSRDLRAPNVGELYQPQGQQFGAVIDPFSPPAPAPAPLVQYRAGGNPDLEEERGTTKSAGVVLQPPGIEGLSISADWYDISLDGAIGSLTPQAILDRCFAGEANLCDLIQRDGTGQLIGISATLINLGFINTAGVDFEMDYSFEELFGSIPGSFNFRILGNYTYKKEVSADGIRVVDSSGEVGLSNIEFATPHWRGSASLGYNRGDFGAFMQARYVGGGTYNNSWTIEDIDDNSRAGRAYLDLSAHYDLDVYGTGVQVYGGVNNAINSDPPIIAHTFPGFVPTNPVLYDVMGRYFYVGARVNF